LGQTIAGKALLVGSPASIARVQLDFHPQIKAAIAAGTARGNSIAVAAVDGIAYGVFEVGDSLKAMQVERLNCLHKQGVNLLGSVTGDSATSAIAMGAAAGIPVDHMFANASPEDKIEFVKSLKAGTSTSNKAKHKVLMIGDGINDAAAIAEADLSMAMGTGTDTAIAAADITLIRPSLTTVTDALQIAKRTVRIIKSNLIWAFGYNLICIPIAASGNLSPMYAGGAMSLSSLFVVINSLRIAR
jgi:Cu+-exporting ATPase